MSKDSVLKKQFIEKDVQRLRNLVQGKYGEKTRSSVGFSKAQKFFKVFNSFIKNFIKRVIFGNLMVELGL